MKLTVFVLLPCLIFVASKPTINLPHPNEDKTEISSVRGAILSRILNPGKPTKHEIMAESDRFVEGDILIKEPNNKKTAGVSLMNVLFTAAVAVYDRTEVFVERSAPLCNTAKHTRIA